MNEERSSPTVEANVFCTSPQGYKSHFKLTFPEASGVLVGMRNLNTLIEAMINAGFTPEAVPVARPQRNDTQPAKKATGKKPTECEFCEGQAIVAAEKMTDKSPDWRCSTCDAAAWGPRKDGGFTLRESTR